MIGTLNALVGLVEQHHDQPVDVAAFAREHGTTEYHLRRMFSALAGLPLSEYVRRRRMTLAAADLVRGEPSLLDLAVRHGYGSAEAFARAFRAVHGIGPADVRRSGGPLVTQPVLRFRLSVEGSAPMDVTITDRPAFVLAGHAAQVPLQHRGVNPRIAERVASIAPEEHARLKALSDTDPGGILAVTAGSDPDAAVGAGAWAVFHSTGPFPDALQQTWAATATEWFPSNPWRLRPGPSIVRYLELTPTEAICELWMPIERA